SVSSSASRSSATGGCPLPSPLGGGRAKTAKVNRVNHRACGAAGSITRCRNTEPTMKITIEVDCTPIEARQFMGLPDVTLLNDSLVEEMTKRMQANLQMMAPGALMKSWMTMGAQAQETFMGLLGASAGLGRGKRE